LYILNRDVATHLRPFDLDAGPGRRDPPDGERSPFDVFEVHADGGRGLGGLALDGLQQRLRLLQDLGILIRPGRR
jgi:hypothetical protein